MNKNHPSRSSGHPSIRALIFSKCRAGLIAFFILSGIIFPVQIVYVAGAQENPAVPNSAAAWYASPEFKEIGTIAVNVANIRVKPSTHSWVIKRLKKGTVIPIVSKTGEWYEIRLRNGREGWAHHTLFEDVRMLALPPGKEAMEKLPAVKTEKKKPKHEAEKITPEIKTDKKKAVKTIVKKKDEPTGAETLKKPVVAITRGKTVANDEDKPMADDAGASVDKEAKFQSNMIVIVKAASGPVRNNPKSGAPIEFKLKMGDTASLEETLDGWYHVRLSDGRTGWAHNSLFDQPVYEKQMDPSAGSIAEIKEIRYLSTDDGEKLFFLFTKEIIPKVSVREGNIPIIVCEFDETRIGKGLKRDMDIGGTHIHQIHIKTESAGSTTLNIVMELVPRKNYNIEPVYFKKQKIYRLTIKGETFL